MRKKIEQARAEALKKILAIADKSTHIAWQPPPVSVDDDPSDGYSDDYKKDIEDMTLDEIADGYTYGDASE